MALEMEAAAKGEVLKARRAINDGAAVVAGQRRAEGGTRDGEGVVPGDKLECAAVGGIDGAEAVGVGVAETRTEVRGEAKVGGEVNELGEEEGAAGGEHEEALEFRGKGRGQVGMSKGLASGEILGGRGESNGEEIGGGAEEAEEGWVAEDHRNEGARGGKAEVGAAAGEDTEGEEVAGFGEEEGLELAGEAEVAVLGCVAVERGKADDLGGGSGDGERTKKFPSGGGAV